MSVEVYFGQKPERSIVTTQTMTASVIAAMVSRMLQVMPRLTHHNSAQHMMTGSDDVERRQAALRRGF